MKSVLNENEGIFDENEAVLNLTALDNFDAESVKEFEKEIEDDIKNDDGKELEEFEKGAEVGSALQQMLMSLRNNPMLEAEQESKLIKIAKTAKRKCERDKAIERLALCNMRLVVYVAKKFRNQGVPFEDLIQEGYLGLMRGIEHFDVNAKTRLSTYVVWWIKQAVARNIADQGRAIRLPVHVNDKLSKIRKAQKELMEKNGKEPSTKQIARKLKMKEKDVEELIMHSGSIMSLEKPMGEDEDMVLGDTIADENTNNQEKEVGRILLSEKIGKVLDTLKEKEREVIILRFGLNDGVEMTLEQVGNRMNITRERVRQIENNALIRIKKRAPELEDYVA